MESIEGFKLVKPARAGIEFWYEARLLFLEVVVALHGLLSGVIEGHFWALMLPMFHPRDQHFFHLGHYG